MQRTPFLIVSKVDEKIHEKLVLEVLKRLNGKNLALKLSKCEFFRTSVIWLGHKLTPSGIIPKITKTEAILDTKTEAISNHLNR